MYEVIFLCLFYMMSPFGVKGCLYSLSCDCAKMVESTCSCILTCFCSVFFGHAQFFCTVFIVDEVCFTFCLFLFYLFSCFLLRLFWACPIFCTVFIVYEVCFTLCCSVFFFLFFTPFFWAFPIFLDDKI